MRLDQLYFNDSLYLIFSKLYDTDEVIDLLKLIFSLDTSIPMYEDINIYALLDIPEKTTRKRRKVIRNEQEYNPLKLRNECVQIFYYLVNNVYKMIDLEDFISQKIEIISLNNGIFGLRFSRHSIEIAKQYYDSNLLYYFNMENLRSDLEDKEGQIKMRSYNIFIENQSKIQTETDNFLF